MIDAAVTAVVASQAAIIAVGAAVAFIWTHRPRLLAQRVHEVVTVHTVTGSSIAGVMCKRGHDGIILRAARYLDAGAEPVQLGGEVYIANERIDFIQAGVGA